MAMSEIIEEMKSSAGPCENSRPVEDRINIEEFSGDNAAEIIKRIMEKENISRTELANRMGCVRQNVSQMLTRGTASMRYDSFYRMVKALGYEILLRKNTK